jgi:hypothetical protein
MCDPVDGQGARWHVKCSSLKLRWVWALYFSPHARTMKIGKLKRLSKSAHSLVFKNF